MFKGDGQGQRTVREKIKFMIRENPLNENPVNLSQKINMLSEALVKGFVQARENPERGSLSVELRRDNVINGCVNLPHIPYQAFLGSEKYIREVFSKVKDHPNAEKLAAY